MNDKVVNIIHYGCISGNINYLGVFAYYGLEKGNNVSEVETNCLSISPLQFSSHDSDDDDEENELVTLMINTTWII